MSSHGGNEQPHPPPPSLWPVGFAVGIAILLTGLVIGWAIVLLGAILTAAFGLLWVRDLRTEGRPLPPSDVETAPGAAPAVAPVGSAFPPMEEEEIERFPRSRFLEGATLGLGGVIGGLVTVPALGFAVLPAFTESEPDEVDVGPLDAFPQEEWRITTFLADPGLGEVSRRTAYVRYNGLREGQPSFTILSSSCVHLGCPVQPNGPINDEEAQEEEIGETVVRRIPTLPAGGFGCPCHGGAYDLEGNRTAGPPVRSLDRYAFAIRDGRLMLRGTFSVGEVRNEGAEAVIVRYRRSHPGIHVDGPSRILYPIPGI